MASLVLRPLAKADLREIALFIENENPGRGVAYVDEMQATFRLYARTSLMGRARPEISDGLRCFPFGNYVIFYRPIQNGIAVVRVLHGARDIHKVLR